MRTAASEDRVLDSTGLADVLARLVGEFDEVLAPVVRDGAICVAPVRSLLDLPGGVGTEQAPGRFRLVERRDGALFAHGPGPQEWKRVLWPPREGVAHITRSPDGSLDVGATAPGPTRRVLFGVRACDLAAIGVLDRVLASSAHPDAGYVARRAHTLIVGVSCTTSAATCFCASVGTGPDVRGDAADIVLIELLDGEHRFLVRAVTPQGRSLLGDAGRPAGTDDRVAAEQAVAGAAAAQERRVDRDALPTLLARLEAPTWEQVAERCLACGNCTLVCPTCFCTTVVDRTDLSGTEAWRERRWDSCFNGEFAYLHGGTVRASTASRYRQWLLHKLATWPAQFDTLGCVGCGRCITWCPVGIDITEEAALAIAAAPPRRDRPDPTPPGGAP